MLFTAPVPPFFLAHCQPRASGQQTSEVAAVSWGEGLWPTEAGDAAHGRSRDPGLEMGLNQGPKSPRWIHSRPSNQGPRRPGWMQCRMARILLSCPGPFPGRRCLLSLAWAACLSLVRGPWGPGPVLSHRQQQARTKSSKGKQGAVRSPQNLGSWEPRGSVLGNKL